MSWQWVVGLLSPGFAVAAVMTWLWKTTDSELDRLVLRAAKWETEARLALQALAANDASRRDSLARYQEALANASQQSRNDRAEFETLIRSLDPDDPRLVDALRDLMDRVSSPGTPTDLPRAASTVSNRKPPSS